MKKYAGLLYKEVQRIFSNSLLMLVFFAGPVLYGILMSNVYKQAKLVDLPIAVIDEDNTPLSAKIIDALNENETVKVEQVGYDAKSVTSKMVIRQYVAVITIPRGFEVGVLQKRYPEVLVDLNLANQVTANFANRGIQSVLASINAGVEIESLKKAGMDAATAQSRFEAFKVNYNRWYNPAGNYMLMMVPGILATIMQQVIFLALALAFSRDFEDGYFSKLVHVSRSSLYHISIKTLPFVFLTAFMWMVMAGFYVVFKIDLPIFTLNMAILVGGFTLACMFMGMLASIAFARQLKATQVLMIIATPSFILSGFTWPREGMPVALRHLAEIIPLTPFLDGFKKLVFFSGTFSDIMPELKSLSIITVVCLLMMIILLQLKIHKQKNAIPMDVY